jgi:hypothetical protein
VFVIAPANSVVRSSLVVRSLLVSREAYRISLKTGKRFNHVPRSGDIVHRIPIFRTEGCL